MNHVDDDIFALVSHFTCGFIGGYKLLWSPYEGGEDLKMEKGITGRPRERASV